MAEYYLISQLPSLDGISENTPLPVTSARFSELCGQHLGKKAQKEFDGITLSPSRQAVRSTSAVLSQWNDGERMLRLALGKLRAEKMNKTFDAEVQSFPAALLQAARTAVEIESPMEAEKFLNRHRLDFLESIRPMDPFSEEYVFYYGLKLKLLERIRQFDTASGEIAYRKIYNSVLNAAGSEVPQ